MEKIEYLHGFKKLGEEISNETGSTVCYYEHEKSGAQLVHLKNEDPHMAFGIGFRTPPEDSTGVAHILEHSVLSGSRKFKTREPFMELLKSSMNTFLNAMTFPDMTIYPLSSMNQKDFKNLVDVYMDAVLFPRIHDMEEIFLQEGWHYHLLDKTDPITYNGVVYNEMRGAYSSPEANVAQAVARALNEGTTYDHEAGGYPYDIPSLSFDDLKSFHKKYYHPSNSLIFLYGDANREEIFHLLDEEYLTHFDARNPDSDLVLKNQPAGLKRREFSYPGDESHTAKEHSYLSYAVSLGHADSVEDTMINTILSEILINSESSPLKKALLENNMGEDLMGLSSDTYYLDFGLAVKHASDERLDELVDIVETTLNKLVEEGIDEKLLLASINRTEFKLREARGSLKGIMYFITAMSAWRYGNDPMALLNFQPVFDKFRAEMNHGFFEKIIKERILENPVKLIAVHRPETGMFTKMDQIQDEKLKTLKESLSDEELDDLVVMNQKLLKFQMTEDSKEDKATIPHLEIEDIERKIPHIEETELKEGNTTILFHPFISSDINYLTASFSMSQIKKEDIVWVGYLSAILGITDTENHSYSELNNEINIYTSGISTNPVVYKKLSQVNQFEARFNVSTSAMGDYSPKMFEFFREVLLHTDFSDSKRLKEILLMLRSNMEAGFDFQGHTIAMARVASFFDQGSRYQEELTGVAFYDHINSLLNNFDEEAAQFSHHLNRVAKIIFNQSDLYISLTGEEERRDELVKEARSFINDLPKVSSNKKIEPVQFELGHRKEALTSASGVQYVAKGFNLKALGHEYNGELTVLSSILSMDYLHNAIRARGGAYGAGISISPNGNVTTFSYRDPNLRATIETYDKMGDFLRNLVLDDEDIKKYIIGSMTRFNPPLTASDINGLLLARRFSDSSEAQIEERMGQAIETTRESIMAKADLIDELMAQDYLAVLGSGDKIKEQKDLFHVIRPIKQKQDPAK